MNRKLKQQLKLAFEAPKPKRKQEFLEQIEKYNQKQRTNVSFWKNFGQKWVWATSFSIILVLVSMSGKVSTIEFDSNQKQCPCHSWVITKTQLYSYSKCITCGEVKSKVEIVTFQENEFCGSKSSSDGVEIVAFQDKKFCVAEEVLRPENEVKLR